MTRIPSRRSSRRRRSSIHPAARASVTSYGKPSAYLAETCDTSAKRLGDGFLKGTVVGMTPVSHGVALPHLRLTTIDSSRMVLVRCIDGIEMDVDSAGTAQEQPEPVRAVFFLVSPEKNPGRHLRILAQIAGRVDKEDFMDAWLSASNHQELKEAVLRGREGVGPHTGARHPRRVIHRSRLEGS